MATSSAYSAATIKTGYSAATPRTENPDLLERFRDPKVCEIPATGKVKQDAFAEFRPKPRTVLDYNISQTDTKVQRKVPTGTTKLHVQQTVADYELPPPGYKFPEEPPPPPPPPPPKFINSTGGGPCWEFADDIWRKKVEKRQEIASNRLQKFIERKKYDERRKLGEHRKLMKLVGPDWFQELSPNQLATIDNLKNCIVKDVKSKSTCNTQASMAELGLVLRPNSKHVKMALKKCCECPVEFLLILYQLMNRHRTEYSLNDRLLLSAVVHLTMRETLKELHIRIPSPPRPPKKPKTPVKKEKRKLYKSPYLVPFTFTPTPRKHTGIYKKNHIQYPESPYFSYISELKTESCEEIIGEDETEDEQEQTAEEDRKVKIRLTNRQSGITDDQEKELLGELEVAQREYNALSSGHPAPFLHKPSIYIPCDHGLKKEVKVAPAEVEETLQEDEEEEKEEEGEEEEKRSSESDEANGTVSVEVRVTTDFDQCYQPIRKVCECKITFDEWEPPKKSEIEEDSGSENGSNECQQEDEAEIKDQNAVNQEEQTDETVKGEDNQCEAAEQLINLGQSESPECQCKEEVEKVIETNLCQCDRCKADRAAALARQKPTYIISGQQEVQINQNQSNEEEETEAINDELLEEGATQVIPVIAGVKAKKTCNCLETYQARVKMYEEMKKRFDAQHDLTNLQQQYIIGGVTRSPTGDPVYMLSGVVPERECPCAKIYQEQLKEASRLANMPKIPMGTQKYVISGVRETEQGNVFVVSGAAAKEDCTCMKMYKCYEKKHMSCLEAYQEYLKKIETDTEEYMHELYSDGRYGDIKPPKSTSLDENGEDLTEQDNEPSDGSSKAHVDFEITNEETKVENSIPQIKEENVKEKEPSQTEEVCHCEEEEREEEEEALDTDMNLTLGDNEQKNEKNECICAPPPEFDCTVCICQNIDVSECKCGDDSSTTEEKVEEEEEIEPDLRRFTILKKMPSKLSEQREILKKALEVLAADGFPLAKLPESYKLPHFKLWMQLRSGKFWTQEERVPMLMESLGYWKHLHYCSARTVKVPELKISKARAAKYTWTQAKFIKQITTEKDLMYYRQLRQATIGDAREFFPSTFSYELPTPNFRDCYFAYVPAKEEDCICWKPWHPHEMKDLSARKSCL